MLDALKQLVPAILRHLLAYSDLLGEETSDVLRQWRRRAVTVGVAAVAAGMSLLLGCTWAIAAAWDGPYRFVVIGTLCIGFGLLAVIALIYTLRVVAAARPPFGRLHREWQADRGALAEMDARFSVAAQLSGARRDDP